METPSAELIRVTHTLLVASRDYMRARLPVAEDKRMALVYAQQDVAAFLYGRNAGTEIAKPTSKPYQPQPLRPPLDDAPPW